jgi:hypothetical protein
VGSLITQTAHFVQSSRATRNLLYEYNTGLKFLAIKGVLLLMGLQDIILSVFFSKHEDDDDQAKRFSEQFIAEYWVCFVSCIEGVLLTILLVYAFPVFESSADRQRNSETTRLRVSLDITKE